MFLGIEIGGTKLQLGLGRGDGVILSLWRGTVAPADGGEGIRRQIVAAVPELLAKAGVGRGELRGVGVGFGGPTDDATQTVITSHQIAGWDGFPLADWVADLVGVPAVVCNDADVAGLAEALYGAGKGLSPIFYITVGTGVGGGLIIDGQIYRGVGRGAAEIGHLRVWDGRVGSGTFAHRDSLESVASGPAIGWWARHCLERGDARELSPSVLTDRPVDQVTAKGVGEAARAGDEFAQAMLGDVWPSVADAICQVIVLLCPRRVVIGGGVSLIGEEHFFSLLREMVAEEVFEPFRGLTDIVPAALGEEVVVHGALALARQKLGG